MAQFANPWMRAQFVDLMRGLSDHRYQTENWQVYRGEGAPYDESDFAVHFLFDDTELANNPESEIGNILFDQSEVEALSMVVTAIDAVFEKYGLELTYQQYIEKPEWLAVVSAAAKVLPLLEANGVGSFE